MQPDRFTVKSQEAVAAAQRLAGQRRNPEVAPAHLLIALLEQEEGLVVPILQKLGADTTAIAVRANEAAAALPTVSGEGQSDARPSSALRSTARLRLLRFKVANGMLTPATNGPQLRLQSPAPGRSTLTTSAP